MLIHRENYSSTPIKKYSGTLISLLTQRKQTKYIGIVERKNQENCEEIFKYIVHWIENIRSQKLYKYIFLSMLSL